MRKALLSFLVLLLLIIPGPVAGATVNCPSKVVQPNETLICTLNTSTNEKLAVYVSSVDGVKLKPGEVLLYVNSSNESRIAWWDGNPLWFRPPAKVELPLNYAFSRITGDYDGPFLDSLGWAFYGKENVFTFTILHENGRNESVEVGFFLEGNPNLGKIIEDYLKLIFLLALIFLGIIGGVGAVVYAVKRTRGRSSKEDFKLFIIIVVILIACFLGFMSLDFVSGLVFHFFGSAEHFTGDMAVGWGITAILLMSLFYISGLHAYSVREVAFKKPLYKLKRHRLSFCSGLVWFPWTLALYPQTFVNEDEWIWVLMVVIITLSFMSDWIVKTLKVKGILALNTILALAIGYLFRPDVSVLVILIIAIGMIYLTQKRCVEKFYAEKERWMEEIEDMLRRYEGSPKFGRY